MKHMVRRPMLPLILLAVMVFSTAFLSFFRADIAAGWEQVDRLYDDARITIELIPEYGWDEIQMKTHKDVMISGMDEISQTLTMQECYYVLRDGTPLPEPVQPEPQEGYEYEPVTTVSAETHTIRGTNDLPWLMQYWDISVEWMDGSSADDFCVTGDSAPCLVREALLEQTGLTLGDTLSVSPTPWAGEIHHQAPTFELTIIGTYEEDFDRTGRLDLLVPEESFLNGPKLFWNGDMMYRCYYRAYAMRVDPAFNREYDRIEDELEQILYDLSAYSFATNARSIENAARPLIQKLQMQELLVLPLGILLLAAAVVAAVLLGLSFDTEVFLRLMLGEHRGKVFAVLTGLIGSWLAVCVGISCAAAYLTAGAEWLRWAAVYSGITTLCALLGSAIPLIRSCGGNLVKSYQSREGE